MAAAVALALIAAACAPQQPRPEAKASPEEQVVMINTPGVSGANCIVQRGAQSWRMTTPGAISLRRAQGSLSVSCFKGNHLRGTARVNPTFAPREADRKAGCLSCAYPSTISVAMALDRRALDAPVVTFGP